MNQNKIVAFLMASIVAISIVAMAMPALGSEDKANVEEEPEVVIDKPPGSEPEPKKPEEPDESKPEVREPDPYFNPVFRDAVIVYFNEMPASLDEFASEYGVKLIFVKEEIKMAAFETEPSSMPMDTSQHTLDFVEEVSKDPCVEKAYEDGYMFVDTKKLYTPEPKITYPEDFDRQGAEYIPNEVCVGFWRLPPSIEEFASRYGAKLKDFDNANEFLLFAVFETDDATGFIKKISTDPYVDSCAPLGVVHGYTQNDPKKISTDPYVQLAELDSIGYIAIHQTAQNGISNEVQRKYNVQKHGNKGKTTRVSRTTAKELPVVHKKIPVVKVMNTSERRGGALYKYPQKIRR
jgi:serine protease